MLTLLLRLSDTRLCGVGDRSTDPRESTSRFGEGIDVACKIANKECTWTIKFVSTNYRLLFERFGSDVAKWKGIVRVERKEYLGKQYVAVVA